MKRRMLSVLLSAMLVIATICISNMPSRAVESEEVAQDETMQDEMGTAEVLSNSEATEAVTEELTEEVTEVTTEELADERVATSVLENSEMVATEEAAEDGTAQNKATEGNEKSSGNVTLTETIADEENSASQTDADTETAGDIKDNELSAENGSADKMQTNEEASEEMQEEITEEIFVDLLEGAEVDKLEDVSFYLWDTTRQVSDEGEKKYSYRVQIYNFNEFDVYVSCLRGYITDEKGNKYNVPVSVKKDTTKISDEEIDITNDINGYWGYKNESVLTDKSVCIIANPNHEYGEGRTDKSYELSYIVPKELEGNFTFHVYAEVVRLDDAFGKVVALCSDSGTYFKYDHVTNVENSNYSISEIGKGDLGNVDIDVYYDGNYLTTGAERNFYIQISNNNDFNIVLNCIMSKWAYENYDSEDEIIKNMQIIHPDGRNMTNLRGSDEAGYARIFDEIEVGGSVIKAGQTATYRVNCMLYSDFGEKTQPIDFMVELGRLDCLYDYECIFNPLNNDTPTISIDKKDETVPDIKLDTDAYDNLISSIFTKTEINSGKHLKVDLIVAAVSEANVGQSDLAIIKAAAKKRKIAVILDMNLVKLIDGIMSGNINQLDKEMTITIDVPKAFLADNRKFSIIRLHDGIAEELPDLDDNPNTVTFTTGKFSLYTLIYEDGDGVTLEPPKNDAPDATVTPVKNNNRTQQTASPNTGDKTPVEVVFILMLVSAFLTVISVKHIKKNK